MIKVAYNSMFILVTSKNRWVTEEVQNCHRHSSSSSLWQSVCFWGFSPGFSPHYHCWMVCL